MWALQGRTGRSSSRCSKARAIARVFVQCDKLKIDRGLAAAICGKPSGYYVNYHTTKDPEGAIRGQLLSLF